MKLDILAIGVHPDDIELSCSGTLLHHKQLGYSFGLCDLTQGELGSRGSAAIRLQEAEKARVVLGAEVRVNLGMADCFFQNIPENVIKIINVLREYRPDIVLANALDDRHPDHGRAAKLVADACFYSGLIKVDTGQEIWRPQALYHYIQDVNLSPDFVVDISEHIDQKMESILCYGTQFFNPNNTTINNNEPVTPISSQGFLEFIKAKNKSMARTINADYAEGFNVARVPGVKDLFQLE